MSRIFSIKKNISDYVTGWYQSKNENDVTLRVSNNNTNLLGSIRLNTNLEPPVFQGYNGLEWVNFNAVRIVDGKVEIPTTSSILKINNSISYDSNEENTGYIIEPRNINLNEPNSLNFRKLTSEKIEINGKMKDLIKIKNENEKIILSYEPQPYIIDNSNIDLNNLKSSDSDIISKYKGSIQKYTVYPDEIISKGQFVCLKKYNNNYYIKPVTYKNKLNLFKDNILVIGVALQNCLGEQQCLVCTEGITTVKISKDIPLEYTSDSDIYYSNYGLLSKDGFVFKSITKPSFDYINCGYFMEDIKITDSNESQYCLFYVKIK